jgi:hypothetical protein
VNTFLEHYREILTDPAHLAVEVTLMLLVDVLFLGAVWPWIKRHIHRDVTGNSTDVAATPLVLTSQGLMAGETVLMTKQQIEYWVASTVVGDIANRPTKEEAQRG